jgi:hypothetical protein
VPYLERDIVQVFANHHLERVKQISVGQVSVLIDVVHLKDKVELSIGGSLGGKNGHAFNELVKVDGAVPVRVKDFDKALGQRVVSYLSNPEQFVHVQATAAIRIQTEKSLKETCGLLRRHYRLK